MAKMNVPRPTVPVLKTHEDGDAVRISPLAQLRRTVMNCLLWENSFYESGVSVADRIKAIIPKVSAADLVALAVEARQHMGLRHVPLLIVREMARGTPEQREQVNFTLASVVKRADEISEFLVIYWSDNATAKPTNPHYVTHPIRRGLAAAFAKFNEYSFAKYDSKEKQVRLRDALFMVHARPADVPANAPKWSAAERKEARELKTRAWPFTDGETKYFRIAEDLLKQQGTWEDKLSAGGDAKEIFTELMATEKLGTLAFIRNVRKMTEAKVDRAAILVYSKTVDMWGVLPHQLITAAKVNTAYEPMFDDMMLRAVAPMEKLTGSTAILVDVSGSMNAALSKRAGHSQTKVEETTRIDAAAAVAIMARELCTDVRIFTFSNELKEVPARRGMALRQAIDKSQPHVGTYLARAIKELNRICAYERIIIITDEQSADGVSKPHSDSRAYMMNVATDENGVGSENHWNTISGWSPHIFRYISALEKESPNED